jgi:hypothetical protein
MFICVCLWVWLRLIGSRILACSCYPAQPPKRTEARYVEPGALHVDLWSTGLNLINGSEIKFAQVLKSSIMSVWIAHGSTVVDEKLRIIALEIATLSFNSFFPDCSSSFHFSEVFPGVLARRLNSSVIIQVDLMHHVWYRQWVGV